jgi:hypothetical protein
LEAQHRYLDDTILVQYEGPELSQNFLSHLNSIRPSIHFAKEKEADNMIAFLDALVIRIETTLATKAYRNPTYTALISQLQI